jgi:hypothetical protein
VRESVEQVTDEIRRFAAIHRGVAIDDPGTEGVWDVGLFPLARVEPELGALGTTVQPDATLTLDCIEARFARRVRQLMEEAIAQRAEPETAAAS